MITFYLKPETEARLLAKAQEQGVSVDALLQQLMNEGEPALIGSTGEAAELPQWHLGARGGLRRRDIYNDVR
jgi:hypothetical protein